MRFCRAGWLAWLLVLGAVAQAQQQCEGCPQLVDPVCGANGQSYMSRCIAECGGVSVKHAGYCSGERLRFAAPPPRTTPKENGAAVSPDVINRYAHEGFTYMGRVKLSPYKHSVGEHTRAQAAAAAAREDSGASLESVLQSNFGVIDAAAASAMMGLQSTVTVDTPSLPRVASVPSGGSATQQVTIQRATRTGDVYTRTYLLIPGGRMSYPPFNPNGTQVQSAPATSAATTMSVAMAATAVNSRGPTPAPAARAPSSSARPSSPARPTPAKPSTAPPSRGGSGGKPASASSSTRTERTLALVASPRTSGAQAAGPLSVPAAKPRLLVMEPMQAPSVRTQTKASKGGGPATREVAAEGRRAGSPLPLINGTPAGAATERKAAAAGKAAAGKAAAGKAVAGKAAAAGKAAPAGRAASPPTPVGGSHGKAGGKGKAGGGAHAATAKGSVAAAPRAPTLGKAPPRSSAPAASKRLQPSVVSKQPRSNRHHRRLAQHQQRRGRHAGGLWERLLSVVGVDDRQRCQSTQWPLTALGMLSSRAADGEIMCSGVLIAPDRVLTAAHCVWDDRVGDGTFLQSLQFTPGQYKGPSGNVSRPYGTIEWESVTVFSAYTADSKGNGMFYDVAVIKLDFPVGSQSGWFGYRAMCTTPSPAPLRLTLGGYPSDPGPGGLGAPGGCLIDACTVNYNCNAVLNNHTCDSFVGQSGGAMYDSEYYVRMVHTLGVYPGQPENGGITLTPFMVQNIALW